MAPPSGEIHGIHGMNGMHGMNAGVEPIQRFGDGHVKGD
jgi:hypothetical protein